MSSNSTVVARNGDKVLPSKRGVQHESILEMGIAKIQLGRGRTIDVCRNCYLHRFAREDETLSGADRN